MLDARRIKAIHVAKTEAGLDEAGYRDMLWQVARVKSSKDESLQDADYQRIMSALRSSCRELSTVNCELPERAGGWTAKQIKFWRRYRGLSGMPVEDARLLLRQVTGFNHEEDAGLRQGDFDQAMAELEAELERRVEGGRASVGSGVDLGYWRRRRPAPGAVNSRELALVSELWGELQPYLDEAKRNGSYLMAMLRQANGKAAAFASVEAMTSRQALLSIETLKRRLAQVREKVREPELVDIPF